MTNSAEMNPHPPSNDGTERHDGSSAAGARPSQPEGPDGPRPEETDDVAAQAPGLYVDEGMGPVPEPNEPA